MFELYIDQNDFIKVSENKKLKVIESSPTIEQFLIDDRPYTQLSDHFGLSMELDYIENLGYESESKTKKEEISNDHSSINII